MDKKKIGEICKISSGGTPSRQNNEYYENGTIKWIKTGDLKNKNLYDASEYITEDALNNSSAKLFPPETVLIAMYGATIGACSILKTEAASNQACAALLPSEYYIPEFMYYYITFRKKDIVSKAVGGAQPNISAGFLKEYEIPLPPLETQKKIVEALDKAQVLIDARKEQIRLMDELVKSQFIEMFGDQKSNPMNWDEGTIRDIVSEVKYGTSKPAIDGGNYKYLRMNNITYEGELDLTSLKYIDMDDDEYEKYVVRKGDVLFNRTNSKELVGKTCVFDYKEEMIIAGYIIRVRVNEKAVPEYLSAFLNSKYGKEKLFSMCKAIVGQANINAQELQDIKVLIPPNTLQAEFAKIKEKVNIEKSKLENNLNEIITIQQALMQQYFG